LLGAGFNVPYTLIVPRERIDQFQLSPLDLANLGRPFVIKPSMGYGKRGVILDAQGKADLARSVQEWQDAQYLLQRRIVPKMLKDSPAYFRVFYVFGGVWCCWWNCYTDQYRVVTPEEMTEFSLAPLTELVCRLADLSGMGFFSSEVALTETGEFVLIDYINDQCHMLTQSSNPKIGVPDAVVAGIAEKLVERAHHLIAETSLKPTGQLA
jgi:hypothetical protein